MATLVAPLGGRNSACEASDGAPRADARYGVERWRIFLPRGVGSAGFADADVLWLAR